MLLRIPFYNPGPLGTPLPPKRKRHRKLAAGLCALLLALHGYATAGQSPKPPSLVIVTSFHENLYATFLHRFQMQHPEIPLKVLNKKTAAAISYIQETMDRPADIFWASSPDAFEVLRDGGYLFEYRPHSPEIPETIRGYPIHDPEGYYTGFAISGYGIMWNRPYLSARSLAPPATWEDLTSPRYFRHIGMSAPSRSGTTHMAVESILQSDGWNRGWATLSEIGGNLATVTARSFGVPDGVNNGRFGIGIVIDFFGLSSEAIGFPVSFAYPPKTALVPANVAIIKGAQHPDSAVKFIDFLVSVPGQNLLFEPHIRRLPVMPKIYRNAPKSYPNPFEHKVIESVVFDSALSKRRYHLVNTLFDQLITYRHKALSRTWKAIHEAERKLGNRREAELLTKVDEARRLSTQVPVSAEMSQKISFTSLFRRKRRGMPLSERQQQIEQQWERFSRTNLKQAQELAQQVITLLE